METNKISTNVESKFEELNNRISILQDIILRMKVDFELMNRNQLRTAMHSQIIKTAEEEINNFINKRPANCKVLDPCTTKVEKTVMEILRLFSEQDYINAISLIDSVIDYIEQYYSGNDICPNKTCLKNAIQVYLTLKNLLNSIEKQSTRNFKVFLNRDSELQLSEGNEKKESVIMSALANEIRIKILKELGKGNLLYSQIERKLGLKGGHFLFHLKNLLKVNLITLDKVHGTYSITTRGLKALQIVHELSTYTKI
jgi:DNA-binding transcriptional ArsR family regulator